MLTIDYKYGHIIISIICVLILLQVWLYYKKHIAKPQKLSLKDLDLGLPFLCVGLVIWAIIKVLKILGTESNEMTITTLSILNNSFFLASFVFFEFGILKKRIKIFRWYLIVIIILAVTVLIEMIGLSTGYKKWVDLMELCYSCATFIGFTYLFFNSFLKRKLIMIAILSIIITFYMILHQVEIAYSPFSKDTNLFHSIYLLSAHASFCFLFIALAFSWIKSEVSKLKTQLLLEEMELTENDEFERRIESDNVSPKEMLKRINDQIEKGNYALLTEEVKLYGTKKMFDRVAIFDFPTFQIKNLKHERKMFKAGLENRDKKAADRRFREEFIKGIKSLYILEKLLNENIGKS